MAGDTFSDSKTDLLPNWTAARTRGDRALVVIQQIGIQRAAADTPESMSLDAAVMNPASGGKKEKV
jgi:hypothetical protein